MTDRHDVQRLHAFALEAAARFQHTGEPAALDAAIRTLRKLAEAAPDGDPDHPAYLNNLGNALQSRYLITRDTALLDEAIAAVRAAITATPAGHPDEASPHNNLGNM